MKTTFLAFLLLCLSWVAPQAIADEVLYQSATLGPTGITEQQLASQEVPATNVNEFTFVGARFFLPTQALTTEIRGHFAKGDAGGGGFFGALVSLDSPNDFPDTYDLSSDDVLATTTLVFPNPSNEVAGILEVDLLPGWYGIVFGSGDFGAIGSGAVVENGVSAADASYFGGGSPAGWANANAALDGVTLIVRGIEVPECGSATLTLLGLLIKVGREPKRGEVMGI
ncbi:hypothetical protein MalM25_27780 [Planctomycetes bacterium MalM25]|nr:hypothetical protein MalM25_27780 [Planctomycetes bacterium MalM25]